LDVNYGLLAALIVCTAAGCRGSETGPHWSTLVPTAPGSPTTASSLQVSPLAGEYTLTLTADSSCVQLPPSTRARAYAAKISGYDSRMLEGELTGSDFFLRYGTFYLIPRPGAAKFYLFSLYAMNKWLEDQPIFERLASGGYIGISGVADALLDKPAAVSAKFDGSFSYCAKATEPSDPDYPPSCAAPVECASAGHTLTLIRR